MNEQLQASLAELINKSISGTNKAQEFLLSEIPDSIQQLLMWHGIYNFVLFIISISIFISIPFFIKGIINKVLKIDFNSDEMDINIIFLILYTALIIIFIPIGSVIFNLQWLKIWIAPKIWLIEYAVNIVK